MRIINFIALALSVLALIYASYVNTVLTESLKDCMETFDTVGDETGIGSLEWKNAGDMINHPEYGIYQNEVPFYQGMTLMPGQSATFEIETFVDWDTTGTNIERR